MSKMSRVLRRRAGSWRAVAVARGALWATGYAFPMLSTADGGKLGASDVIEDAVALPLMAVGELVPGSLS